MVNTPAKVNRKMQPDIVHFCDALPLGKDLRPYCEQLIERQIRVKEEFLDTAIMKDLEKVKHLVEAVRRAEEFLQ